MVPRRLAARSTRRRSPTSRASWARGPPDPSQRFTRRCSVSAYTRGGLRAEPWAHGSSDRCVVQEFCLPVTVYKRIRMCRSFSSLRMRGHFGASPLWNIDCISSRHCPPSVRPLDGRFSVAQLAPHSEVRRARGERTAGLGGRGAAPPLGQVPGRRAPHSHRAEGAQAAQARCRRPSQRSMALP